MRIVTFFAPLFIGLLACSQTPKTAIVSEINHSKQNENTIMSTNTIYDFKVKDLAGAEFDFASLKGKKL